jgi:hypothetical protein
MNMTHDVINQGAPRAGVDLLLADRPLRDALAVQAPQLRSDRPAAVGAHAGPTVIPQLAGRDGEPRFVPHESRRTVARTADVVGLLAARRDLDAIIGRSMPNGAA